MHMQYQMTKALHKTTNEKNKKNTPVRRNRSSYNFFYKHQRSIILREIICASAQSDTHHDTNEMHRHNIHHGHNVDISLLNMEEKPVAYKMHQKTHGMINLKELTTLIAKRWKEVNHETKKLYQDLANKDFLRYREEIACQSKQISEIKEEFYCCSVCSQYFFIQDKFSPRSIECMKSKSFGAHHDGQCLTANDKKYFYIILSGE